jgi:hypothetical protein
MRRRLAISRHSDVFARPSIAGALTRTTSTPSRIPTSSSLLAEALTRAGILALVTNPNHPAVSAAAPLDRTGRRSCSQYRTETHPRDSCASTCSTKSRRVIWFGFYSGTPEELRANVAKFGYPEQQEAIAPYVESVSSDGLCDTVEDYEPYANRGCNRPGGSVRRLLRFCSSGMTNSKPAPRPCGPVSPEWDDALEARASSVSCDGTGGPRSRADGVRAHGGR